MKVLFIIEIYGIDFAIKCWVLFERDVKYRHISIAKTLKHKYSEDIIGGQLKILAVLFCCRNVVVKSVILGSILERCVTANF